MQFDYRKFIRSITDFTFQMITLEVRELEVLYGTISLKRSVIK